MKRLNANNCQVGRTTLQDPHEGVEDAEWHLLPYLTNLALSGVEMQRLKVDGEAEVAQRPVAWAAKAAEVDGLVRRARVKRDSYDVPRAVGRPG